MKRISVIVLVVVFVVSAGCCREPAAKSSASPNNSATSVGALFNAIYDLSSSSNSENPDPSIRMQLDGLVNDSLSSRELYEVARLCAALAHPHVARSRNRDASLDYATERCIGLLSDRVDHDAVAGLEGIHRLFYNDGGSALIIKSAIEHQRKKRNGVGSRSAQE